MKTFLVTLTFTVALVAGCASAAKDYLDMPEVHVSHSTGQCVRLVEADGSSKPCPKNLPDRYQRVWVE